MFRRVILFYRLDHRMWTTILPWGTFPTCRVAKPHDHAVGLPATTWRCRNISSISETLRPMKSTFGM